MNKEITKIYDDIILESSLSKVWRYIQKHDCAIISAFRNREVNCVNGKSSDRVLTYKEKMVRSRELYAILMAMDVGVTRVDGSFIENYGKGDLEKEVKENSFFVVNSKDHPDFFEKIIKLGKKYCQDSIVIKPKESEIAYLYGTNLSDFPGLDKKSELSVFRGGVKSEFMTRVGDRPFTFSEAKDYNVATRGVFFAKPYQKFLSEKY